MTMSTRPGLAGEADPLVDTQPAASDSPPAPDMVWVPGGSYLMGLTTTTRRRRRPTR